MDAHKWVLHNDLTDTLSELRSAYWLVRHTSICPTYPRKGLADTSTREISYLPVVLDPVQPCLVKMTLSGLKHEGWKSSCIWRDVLSHTRPRRQRMYFVTSAVTLKRLWEEPHRSGLKSGPNLEGQFLRVASEWTDFPPFISLRGSGLAAKLQRILICANWIKPLLDIRCHSLITY